jgi:hypothetical protein
VREDEVYYILKSCHDELCGGHFSNKRTTKKFVHLVYYWPIHFRDAKKYVKSCDSCQRVGKPIQSDEIPLKPQILIEHFER